ncbi:hypothetical protein [Nonomuraea sp. NPDC049400]|uniref:hypothetical protein n=1 Tax=Nonomuraea sp. NPDC049400 TaxID=3364352 RepID=UPI0037ACF188
MPWEVTDPWVVKEQEMGRSSRIVLQHDLARQSPAGQPVGATGAEREQMRAERLARGEPNDDDLWDDA